MGKSTQGQTRMRQGHFVPQHDAQCDMGKSEDSTSGRSLLQKDGSNNQRPPTLVEFRNQGYMSDAMRSNNIET